MFTVVIYKKDGGCWFMDDSAKSIVAEPLILEHVLMRREPENDGYWYELKGTATRGWLCPVLFQYFDEAPPQLYISWEK